MRHWWIGLTAVLLVAAAPAITRWQVQPASSAIGFSVSGGGQTAEGGFARYVARIRFAPDRLSQSSAIVDRKSVVQGKSGSVRVDLGGRRILKKKKKHKQIE